MYKSFYTILTNPEANLGELDCLRHELLPKGGGVKKPNRERSDQRQMNCNISNQGKEILRKEQQRGGTM